MQQVQPGFYGGDAFRIDTSAATNYYLKRQAQQQAKEAALDKYYKGLVSNATPTGMRAQEVPAFQAALNDFRTFYTENSSKIASGMFPELALEADKKAAIPAMIAAQGKNNFARDKNIATIRGTNPEVAKRWTQNTWNTYQKSTKAQYLPDPSGRGVIENPEYSDFDPMAIVLNPKEVDLSKQWDEAGKDIERSETTIDEADDLDPRFYTKRTVKTSPTVKGLNSVATKAASQWNDETEFTFGKDKTFAQFKLDSPDKYNELTASYQKVFPGKVIDNDKDLYIATAINLADKEELKPTQRIRDDKKWADYNRSQNIAGSKEIAKYNHSLSANAAVSEANARTYFEEIPSGVYTTQSGKKVEKKGDRWVDASGKPLTTSGDDPIKVTGSNIPNGFVEKLPAKYQVAVDYMDLHVNDGVASGAYNEFTKLVPRRSAIKSEFKGTKQKPAVTQMGAVTQGGDDPLNIFQ
jgi:hypothetical protein